MKHILRRLAHVGYILTGITLLLQFLPLPRAFAARVELQYFTELKMVSDILKLVELKFVDEETVASRDKLIEGSIEGILKKLDDPFSRFMPASVHTSMQEETQGEFGGLGILLGIKDQILTVISPMDGTPAFRAGIRAGDQLLKINETSTEGMDVEAAVKIMRGKPGTSINITVRSEGQKDSREITVVRDFIKVPSVRAGLLTTGIGYARISSFSASTGKDLDDAISEFEAKGLSGMVLDLRGNPGGLLSAAVEVAQDLLGNGKTIVSIRGREGEESVFTSQANKQRDFPLAVLIDAGSASASEIVAGAIKDHRRGILLGSKSYGKGSVQTVMPLQNGAALALTTAYYYTPAGVKIHKIGITPDIDVPFPRLNDQELQEYRKEMDDFVSRGYEQTKHKQDEYLNGSAASTSPTSTTSSMFMPVSKHDVQLGRALDVLKAIQVLNRPAK